MVTAPVRLMGYKSLSWPMGANQAESFLQEQLNFIGALDETIKKSLIIRINKNQDRKMRSGYFERLCQAFHSVQIDDSTKHIKYQIHKCRVFVYACNSSGFLETLGRDIPTVIFWNPAYFELRARAQPYFDQLKEVGIFHETSESAAVHVAKVWDDVGGWWNQPAVQEARRSFCKQYAHMPEHPIRVLKEALSAIPAASNN